MSKNKGKIIGQKIVAKQKEHKSSGLNKIKIEYPHKCKYCPKILYSPQQEDIHFRNIHVGK